MEASAPVAALELLLPFLPESYAFPPFRWLLVSRILAPGHLTLDSLATVEYGAVCHPTCSQDMG